MLVTPIKTHKIKIGENLLNIVDTYLISLSEGSVLAITSKIISLCQKRVVRIGSISKEELIKRESQYFLPASKSRYQVSFSIINTMLAASAGIDESNGDGYYILLPKDPQDTANRIRQHIAQKTGVRDIGVLITDSRTVPLRWGVTAASIASSGFRPIKDYIGLPDLYGRPFAFEKLHIADSLAAAAGLVMGEGAEQTPMALLSDIPQIAFQQSNPTEEELHALCIAREDDLYAPLLTSVKWKKGAK